MNTWVDKVPSTSYCLLGSVPASSPSSASERRLDGPKMLLKAAQAKRMRLCKIVRFNSSNTLSAELSVKIQALVGMSGEIFRQSTAMSSAAADVLVYGHSS